MLRIITYNCHNIKNSIQDICDLCNSYEIIFLLEIWLFQHELPLLSNNVVTLKALVLLPWIFLKV